MGNIFDFYEDLLTNGLGTLNDDFLISAREVEIGSGENKRTELIYQESAFSGYTHEQYLQMASKRASRKILQDIESNIMQETSIEKQRLQIKRLQSDTEYYIEKIKETRFTEKFPFFLADLQIISEDIPRKLKYLIKDETPGKQLKKIQWLGNVNLLTTLIYHLWQGQEKSYGPAFKGLIKAEKGELKAFLLNNFLDSDGRDLKPDTVDDGLNTSDYKSDKRLIEGKRIELSFKK